MTEWVLASGNQGKLKELQVLLRPLGQSLSPQSRWEVPEAEETGLTFVENALIKARQAAAMTGLAAIGDDSGLVVPALGGQPGIYSSRYAGEHCDHADNIAKLLAALNAADSGDRSAYFYCVMVFLRCHDDPAPVIASGSWHGEIAAQPQGDGGFGYDPVFLSPELGLTAAELEQEDKNRRSHRGQACRRLIRLLSDSRT